MKSVTLQFPTIISLLDFESLVEKDGLDVDSVHLTIKGEFEEADIELAKAGYKAFILEEPQ